VKRSLVSAFLTCIASGPALALTPPEVFDKVAPSVWAVRALDAQERPFSHGSAVVIGRGRLVTNCHVLAKAKSIQVRRENVSYEAKLEHADVERDLCTLSVSNFTAPAVQTVNLAQVKVGQRVYAVGNPERLALTLSEGLISGLRSEDPQLPPLQTSAPISPGSSGGGLFDERGALIGITTLVMLGRTRIAQNLNFAAPAEWIKEIPERAQDQLAKRRERQAAPSGSLAAAPPAEGLPAVGTSWKYSFRDQRYSQPEQIFTIRVVGVEGWDVRESFDLVGDSGKTAAINAKEITFAARRVAGGYSLVELAPYFYSSELGKSLSALHRPVNYPTSGLREWRIDVAQVDSDEAVVPAGTFKTTRVVVTGTVQSFGSLQAGGPASVVPARFHYTAWYAPEVNRYVKVQHQTWNSSSTLIGDEIVQLLEYRSN